MKNLTSKILEAPNSKESEMITLGCMLTNINSFNIAADDLSSEDFYYQEHKTIFQILKEAFKNDKPADIHLIAEELKRMDKLEEVGGVGYLTTLAQYAGISAHVEEYCKILQNKSHSRQALSLLEDAKKDFLDNPEDPSKISEKHCQKFIELGKKYSPNDKASIGEILSDSKSRINPIQIIERLKLRQEFYKEHGRPYLTGLPTGYIDFDNKVTILEATNLIVVAGRPAMGKTAFALNVLSNICFDQYKPVGFISLEMSANQLVERILSIRTSVAGEKIKRGIFNDDEYKKLKKEDEKLRKTNFFIHDQAISTVSQVVSRARRLKDEEDIQILAIDYIQLLGTDSKNDSRQYEVAEVSRILKQLAMELKIPVIIIAQLSRKVEERSDKRPLMSDLRDSGQIEQDADAIVFLYRREYYDLTDKKGQAEIILSKNRHGPIASINLSFQSDCGIFGNFSSSDSEKPW